MLFDLNLTPIPLQRRHLVKKIYTRVYLFTKSIIKIKKRNKETISILMHIMFGRIYKYTLLMVFWCVVMSVLNHKLMIISNK